MGDSGMLFCDAASLVADVSEERVDFVFKVSRLIINDFSERNKAVSSGVPKGAVSGVETPRNSEVSAKLSRIPSSVENTSVTVWCSYSIILIS
jgi:hypothetical protein